MGITAVEKRILRWGSRAGVALCMLLFGSGPVASSPLPSAIEGNHRIPSSMIRRWLADVSATAAEELARRVQERCRQAGFYDAVVAMAPDSGSPGHMRLHIQEGEAVNIGAVTIEAPHDFSQEFPQLDSRTMFSGVASVDNIERGFSGLLRELSDAGYALAQASAGDFRRDGNMLHFAVQVLPGPRARVGAWRISGLGRTDSSRVRKLVGLRVGTLWNLQERKHVERRLSRLNYLGLAGEIHLADRVDDSLVIVEVPLTERPALLADGGLGFGGQGSAEAGVHGRLNLTIENPFGDGRRVDLWVCRLSPGVSESRLRVSDPHVAGTHTNAAVELEQVRQTTYDRFSLAADGGVFFDPAGEAKLAFRWSRITPLGTPGLEFSARCYDVTAAVRSGSWDEPDIHARHSTTWKTSLTASFRRELNGRQNPLSARTRMALGLGHSWRPHASWFAGFSGMCETWLGPATNLRWGDELYLGGPGTVRGFAERSIRAGGYALASAETGYAPVAGVCVIAFADLAVYRRFAGEGTPASKAMISGYGLGVETDHALGRTRLELAWPRGAALGEGMIYLGWVRGW